MDTRELMYFLGDETSLTYFFESQWLQEQHKRIVWHMLPLSGQFPWDPWITWITKLPWEKYITWPASKISAAKDSYILFSAPSQYIESDPQDLLV